LPKFWFLFSNKKNQFCPKLGQKFSKCLRFFLVTICMNSMFYQRYGSKNFKIAKFSLKIGQNNVKMSKNSSFQVKILAFLGQK